MKKIRFTIFLMILFFISSLSISAQTKETKLDPKTKEAIKELLKEVYAFAKGSVLPKMKEWKGDLDKAMAPADLQSLNTLRAEAKSLRKKTIEYGLGVRRAEISKNNDSLNYFKEKLKSAKADMKNITEDLKPLAEKYKPTLEEIGKSSKPEIEKWKVEIFTILKTWLEKNKDVISPETKMKIAEGLLKLKLFDMMGQDKKDSLKILEKKLTTAFFMLWDGGDLPEFESMFSETGKSFGIFDPIPEGYNLLQNYPNPFNPSTTITFSIPKQERVKLTVYDALGKEVATLIDDERPAGEYQVIFTAKNISTGIYFYRLRAGETVIEKKMQFVK